jgi:putative two-component system response regulator
MDGRGYHRGLAGHDLSLTARILAVADVTDALVADRPYRAGMPPDQVLSILAEGRGSHLCPACVDACSPEVIELTPTAQLVPATELVPAA